MFRQPRSQPVSRLSCPTTRTRKEWAVLGATTMRTTFKPHTAGVTTKRDRQGWNDCRPIDWPICTRAECNKSKPTLLRSCANGFAIPRLMRCVRSGPKLPFPAIPAPRDTSRAIIPLLHRRIEILTWTETPGSGRNSQSRWSDQVLLLKDQSCNENRTADVA